MIVSQGVPPSGKLHRYADLESLVKLKYYGEEMPFELVEYDNWFVTCLILDDETEEEFEELGESEPDRDEEWYLDENGYWLEPEAFHFDTLAGYGGETFKWLHSRP